MIRLQLDLLNTLGKLPMLLTGHLCSILHSMHILPSWSLHLLLLVEYYILSSH